MGRGPRTAGKNSERESERERADVRARARAHALAYAYTHCCVFHGALRTRFIRYTSTSFSLTLLITPERTRREHGETVSLGKRCTPDKTRRAIYPVIIIMFALAARHTLSLRDEIFRNDVFSMAIDSVGAHRRISKRKSCFELRLSSIDYYISRRYTPAIYSTERERDIERSKVLLCSAENLDLPRGTS